MRSPSHLRKPARKAGFSTFESGCGRETDCLLEGNGFEISVPRQDRQHFDASVGLGPIDCRRGGIIRAVVGLGKPIDLFRRLDQPPLTAK